MKTEWKIYYGDKTTFDSTQGSASEAPCTNVICIKYLNKDNGWICSAFKDFYLWHDEEWWGADDVGFWQYMFSTGDKVVKFGASVPSHLFNEIMATAINDPVFGAKSALTPKDFGYKTIWKREG